MIRALLSFLNGRRFRRFVADLDKREARARAANDCREIGRVRKERRTRMRAAIEQAAAHAKIEREVRQRSRGWRSGWGPAR